MNKRRLISLAIVSAVVSTSIGITAFAKDEKPKEIVKVDSFINSDSTSLDKYFSSFKEEQAKETAVKKAIAENNALTNSNQWLQDYGINPKNLSNKRLEFLDEAHDWVGSWYLYGGEIPPERTNGVWESPSTGRGFDCSSYVEYALKKTRGYDIGRTTHDQPDSSHLHIKSFSNAQPGDLVYSHSGEHVGIFIRNNGDGTIKMMHDPKTGDKVKIGNYHTNVNIYSFD